MRITSSRLILLLFAGVFAILITVAFFNPAMSDLVKSPADADLLTQKAITESNPSICGRMIMLLSGISFTTQGIRDGCYIKYLNAHPNVNVCPPDDVLCLTHFAAVSDEPAVCLDLPQQSQERDCVLDLADRYHDATLCNLLSGDKATYCSAKYYPW